MLIFCSVKSDKESPFARIFPSLSFTIYLLSSYFIVSLSVSYPIFCFETCIVYSVLSLPSADEVITISRLSPAVSSISSDHSSDAAVFPSIIITSLPLGRIETPLTAAGKVTSVSSANISGVTKSFLSPYSTAYSVSADFAFLYVRLTILPLLPSVLLHAETVHSFSITIGFV